MRHKSGPDKALAEQGMKDIRRATRRQFSAEGKIRVMIEGLRGQESISELCRREGIASSQNYGWSSNRICRPAGRSISSTFLDRPSTAGTIDTNPAARRRWPTGDLGLIAYGTASRMMSVRRSSTWRWKSRSFRRGSWPLASPMRKDALFQRLRCFACSRRMISSPAQS